MEKSDINLNLLGIKAQTKNELYRLLTVEAKLYLPPQKETSIYFIRGIVNGRKRVIYFLICHILGILYRWSKDLISSSDR